MRKAKHEAAQVSRIVKTITSPDGQYRVEIVERRDGRFGFFHMRNARSDGKYWPRLGPSNTITDTAEAAEREARATIPWLIQMSK